MAISNATTREVFEAITTTFEDRLDTEVRMATAVGIIIFLVLTVGMLVGGQLLN